MPSAYRWPLTSLDEHITRGPTEADCGSGPLGQGVLGKYMFGIQSRKEACGPDAHGPWPFASLPGEVIAVECGCWGLRAARGHLQVPEAVVFPLRVLVQTFFWVSLFLSWECSCAWGQVRDV